jgi:hypothetical protein
MNTRKYRHEIKFIISKQMSLILKQRLALAMDVDKNSVNLDNTYFIRSLYFDDINSTAYYEKIDGVLYRKKYRIRIYNNDSSFIRLERKWKHNNMTSKDQLKISKENCINLLTNQFDNIDKELLNNSLMKEFITDIKVFGLKPSVIVDYKRLAYTYPISEVRITFDERIKSGLYNCNLFNMNRITYDVIDNNEVVLEVKFNEVLPEHISIILQTIPMYRQAVSKFALCRSIK